MRSLSEFLNESNKSEFLNESNINPEPDTPCLIQYTFKNGWRDTQLSRLLYEPKFNNIDPGKCGNNAEFECGIADEFAEFTNDFNPIIEKIKKALNNDIKLNNLIIEEDTTTHDSPTILFKCPVVKIIPLKEGEPIPPAQLLYYFNGQWIAPNKMYKEIQGFVLKITGVNANVRRW